MVWVRFPKSVREIDPLSVHFFFKLWLTLFLFFFFLYRIPPALKRSHDCVHCVWTQVKHTLISTGSFLATLWQPCIMAKTPLLSPFSRFSAFLFLCTEFPGVAAHWGCLKIILSVLISLSLSSTASLTHIRASVVSFSSFQTCSRSNWHPRLSKVCDPSTVKQYTSLQYLTWCSWTLQFCLGVYFSHLEGCLILLCFTFFLTQ